MFLIFDTETTGLPKRWDAPISDLNNWPRVVQLAWQLHDRDGSLLSNQSYIIKPDDFDIPFESEKVHGISTLLAIEIGEKIQTVLDNFIKDLSSAKFIDERKKDLILIKLQLTATEKLGRSAACRAKDVPKSFRSTDR